ncbi:MAG: hypothetical protein JST91_06315 [Actinobacteria bacterium]|nr:hypothetical protein [Actinomycetota bacterium]
MLRPRPGWLVAFLAGVLLVSAWLPWLTTGADGGGRANAIGGAVGSLHLPPRFGAGQLIVLLAATLIVAGAMSARGLAIRPVSVAALSISILLVALTVFYFRVNVAPPVAAGYGLYVGLAVAVGAVLCSIWAVVSAFTAGRSS